MKKIVLMAAASSMLALSGCSVTTPGPDLGQVLDRTVFAIEYFTTNSLPQPINGVSDEPIEVSDEKLTEFTTLMRDVMNATPQFYDKPVGIELMADASFSGFVDKNFNNIQESGETQIFTVEIDAENSRLIATDTVSGEGTFLRGSGTGFLAGAIVGRLLGRQRAAGIKPSSFSSRKLTSRTDYASKRRTTTRARSSTRTGSSRSGK